MNNPHDGTRRDVHDRVHEPVHETTTEGFMNEPNDVHEHPPVNGAGTVIPLPRRGDREDANVTAPGSAVEPRGFGGELLSEEENKALDRRLPSAALVRRLAPPARATVTQVVRVARVVRESERTRQAGKGLLRVALDIVQGVESWAKRAYDASTMGVYRRQIKAAEATGNQELLSEWMERKEAAVEKRHDRLLDLFTVAWGIVRVAFLTLVMSVFTVLFVALMVWASGRARSPASSVASWTPCRLDPIEVSGCCVAPFRALSVPPPGVAGRVAGRPPTRHGNRARLVADRARDAGDVDVTIDETTIARALGQRCGFRRSLPT